MNSGTFLSQCLPAKKILYKYPGDTRIFTSRGLALREGVCGGSPQWGGCPHQVIPNGWGFQGGSQTPMGLPKGSQVTPGWDPGGLPNPNGANQGATPGHPQVTPGGAPKSQGGIGGAPPGTSLGQGDCARGAPRAQKCSRAKVMLIR